MKTWAESTKSSTGQRLANQTRMSLKKGWFSDLEILKIWGHVGYDKYEQEPQPKMKQKI